MQNSNLEAARIRDSQFSAEGLGNLAKFYRDTAEVYRQKQVLDFKKQEKLMEDWEKRFQAAEMSFQEQKKKPNILRFLDPLTNQGMFIQSLLDSSGKRRTFSDILAKDTSKRGNVFALGKSAEEMLSVERDIQNWEKTAGSYEMGFQNEVTALEKRNASAKEAFLTRKKESLQSMQTNSYARPTYTEKPL
jgi:hypothetical protein